ncbi:MAG: xanthine dehydrogenase family protein molybdopterin-binding subunit [Chloroflexi bacterium]|nr:xanthine dehydrogenase family protein molybdopterin-binding subunit [Chloroflexota bacterium]
MNRIGEAAPRVDGLEKVTGREDYLGNLVLEGMAHARLVRSTMPHALIRDIDTGAARRAPGVLAVVTGGDLLHLLVEPYWGPAFLDQSPLAIGRVRHVGEPVAAVVAESAEEAEAAADLVSVDYDALPAVFDPVEARKPEAPLIHELVRPSRAFVDLATLRPTAATNVNLHYRLRRGDVAAAFAEADVVIEGTYRYPRNQPGALEPHITIARVDADGRITVWSATQSPHIVRGFLAMMFGVPLQQVRVVVGPVGGAYGGKTYMKLEPIAAALAKVTGRPVRVLLAQEEEFFVVNNHGAWVRLKTGATRDGRLVAAECEAVWDSGAFADIGPRIAQKSGLTGTGPYDIPNVRIDSYSVYTNLPPTGPVRGFGVSQLCWAYESQMDRLARELGLDPLELRRRNLLRAGQEHPTGTVMQGVDLHGLLDGVEGSLASGRDEPVEPRAAVAAAGSEAARGMDGRSVPALRQAQGERVRRGRGFAIGMKAVLTPSRSEARVEVDAEGVVRVYCSAVEIGQGASTVMAQIAADGLGCALSRVRVVHPDTDVTPFDLITAGSRATHHVGQAVWAAARDLRERLLAAAAAHSGMDTSRFSLDDGVMVRLVAGEAGVIAGEGAYETAYQHADAGTGQSPLITNHWMCGAAGAEVEVDTATGRVRVTRLVVAGDAGTAINPAACHRQLAGAGTMGLGHTLMEEICFDGGQPTNGSFVDYPMPSLRDLPAEFVTVLQESEAHRGIAGAKGLGETGIIPIAPAIANAIEDAVGVRITELPITAERVYAALQRQAGVPVRASR